MLRAITFDIGPITSTFGGVLVLMGAVLVWLFVPWLDRSKVRSARYRPAYKLFYWLFIADIVLLGWLGAQPITDASVLWSQIATAYYFIFFFIVMPLLPKFEKTRIVPRSISEDMAAKAKNRWRLW